MQRPTYAEVDLSAIRDNITAIRRRVGAGVKIMPAVKANGYGHGAIQTSRACIDGGADVLCVACLEEAIELREAGFDEPIMIVGCALPSAAGDLVHYKIIATVCDMGLAKAISIAAVKQGTSANVHIKIDTGMGRIGFRPDKCVEIAREVYALPGLSIEGVFTHFPCSDEADRSFTHAQIELFKSIVEGVRSAGINVPIAHASNSGGILAFPEADFDAVRPGIMIYGAYPSQEVIKSIPIREALTLKSQIVFLKEVERGATLSYGRTFAAKRLSNIATLPIGYADGYSRMLSNKGEAAVRGKRVPVVGRVCMDQILIDVTDVPGAALGDDVTLYGGGYDYLSVTNIANMIGTISYEVFCNISQRVPRIYLNA
ncbi:MAG: alanine racemase [Armatimonadetes bacterium]|nr:alanine racemase [Armatimonadota bacterium]